MKESFHGQLKVLLYVEMTRTCLQEESFNEEVWFTK